MSNPALQQATSTILHGTLHVFVAFDWGDEILLERVQQLAPPLLPVRNSHFLPTLVLRQAILPPAIPVQR
jgi:hypothetical protein